MDLVVSLSKLSPPLRNKKAANYCCLTASRLMVYLQIIVLIVPIVQISVTSGFIVDDAVGGLVRSQYSFLLVIECYGRVDIVK